MRYNPDFVEWKENIRQYRIKEGYDKWGFRIYRCTYSSQPKWKEFLSYIKEDAYELFIQSKDADLEDSLDWSIIEDKSSLDGLSCIQVRDIHDAWIMSEVEKKARENKNGEVEWDEEAEKTRLIHRVFRHPEYEYFIYVDEGVLNSVIENGRYGRYYITLVKTSIGHCMDEEEDRKWRELGWPGVNEKGEGFQWFKAYDIVKLFGEACSGVPWDTYLPTEGDEGEGIYAVDVDWARLAGG